MHNSSVPDKALLKDPAVLLIALEATNNNLEKRGKVLGRLVQTRAVLENLLRIGTEVSPP